MRHLFNKFGLISWMSLSVLTLDKATAGTCHPCNQRAISGNIRYALACNAFKEARGEGFEGMVAVNRTVIARSQSGKFPSSLISVIFQAKQFSWTARPGSACDSSSWKRSIMAADTALRQGSNGKLYFHAKSIRPHWSFNCTGRMQINNHIYYSDCHPGGRRAKTIARHKKGWRTKHFRYAKRSARR